MGKKILYLLFSLAFSLNLFAIELFGVQVNANISNLSLEGSEIQNSKGEIYISLDEKTVPIPNTYFNQYIVEFNENGNVYSIIGENSQTSLNPVQCLKVQKEILDVFSDKYKSEYNLNIHQSAISTRSKVVWDIALSNKTISQNLIFSIHCDYSFNNRRIYVHLLELQNPAIQNVDSTTNQEIEESKEKVDTSGI